MPTRCGASDDESAAADDDPSVWWLHGSDGGNGGDHLYLVEQICRLVSQVQALTTAVLSMLWLLPVLLPRLLLGLCT
jgi:hypothetical protein